MEKKKEVADQNQQPSTSNQNQSQTAVCKSNRLTGIFGHHPHQQQQEPPSDNPRPTTGQDPLKNVKIPRAKRSSTTNTARFPSHHDQSRSAPSKSSHFISRSIYDPFSDVGVYRGPSLTRTKRSSSNDQHTSTSTAPNKGHHQITPTSKSLKISNADNTDDQKTSSPRYGFEFKGQREDENGRITPGYAKFIREEFPAKLRSFMPKVPRRRYKEQDANTVNNSRPSAKKDEKKKYE